MNRKRIALFIGKLAGGGAERAASTLSFLLSEYFDVYMLIYNSQHSDYGCAGKVIDLGRGTSSFPIMAVRTLVNFNKAIKDNKIDLVISFCEFPNIVNGLFNRTSKSITSIRTYYKMGFASTIWEKIKYWIQRQAFAKSDAIWVLTEAQKRILAEETRINTNKTIVNGNIYDIRKIVSDSRDNEIDQSIDNFVDEFTAVGIGRLDSGKNFESMLEILAEVKRECRGAKLLILGDGAELSNLKAKAHELGIEGSVMFSGRVKNPFPYVRKCSVYVSTTRFEGFPNSLVEAMALGVPVIQSDCPLGPRDILCQNSQMNGLADGDVEYADYGILTPICRTRHDIENIASVWTRMLVDKKFRVEYGERAQKGAYRYDKTKSIPVFASKIADVIG